MAYTVRVDGCKVVDGGDEVLLSLYRDGLLIRAREKVFISENATGAEALATVRDHMQRIQARVERPPRFTVGQEVAL